MPRERLALATALGAMLGAVVVCSLAALVGRVTTTDAPMPPAFAAIGVGLAAALGWRARRGSGPVHALAQLMPPSLDGSAKRHPRRAWLVALLLLVGVAQWARLSCFMADDQLTWGAAFPPVAAGTKHMCQGSYVQAAELSRRGEPNLYLADHYPAFSDAALGEGGVTQSPVDHLAPYIEDAFEYPPPFLLVPRAMLAMSNDFRVHRTLWFLIQASLFVALGVMLTMRLRGPARAVSVVLLPAAFASLPGTFTLQFGQWHLVAVMLSLGGMIAIERERDMLGGALLGAAVVTKIFPGLLLIYLLRRRRFRAVAATLMACALYAGLGVAILGAAPLRTFIGYQLPRIASGEAFSFAFKSDLVIASNYGIYGLPIKLQRLGVPGMSRGLGSLLTWAYGLLVVALAWRAGRCRGEDERAPAMWLGLLVLASLRSPLAPNVYTAAPAMWLLTLQAHRISQRRAGVVLVTLAFVTMGGLPPLPNPRHTIALWMTGQLALMLVALGAVLTPKPS
jgi:Glycosyltransferase family 87